jgi:hypothetical protein
MKTHIVVFFLSLCVFPQFAFGLGTESFGNAPIEPSPDWPSGIEALIQSAPRVYSSWVNGYDRFYYRGDRDAFTQFLNRFAKIELPVHRMILDNTNVSPSFKWEPVLYDWILAVPSGVSLAYFRYEKGTDTIEQYPSIHISKYGQIDVNSLAIPENITISEANQNQNGWGQPRRGLKCCLRPSKSQWPLSQTPCLQLDLRNRGATEFRLNRRVDVHCQIEVDAKWYGWAEPIVLHEIVFPLYPGQDDTIEIKLSNSWALPRAEKELKFSPGADPGGERLKLDPGKHIVRVRFHPYDPNGRYSKISIVSNPVEVEILEKEKPAPDPNQHSSEPNIPASDPSLWIQASAYKLANRPPDFILFKPKTNPTQEIFDECMRVNPLPADKTPIYKNWLQDRIAEIQRITTGTTRKRVNEILKLSEGLFLHRAVYLDRKCDVLKVDIEFLSLSRDAMGLFTDENDKVISVSMPYLGLSPSGYL